MKVPEHRFILTTRVDATSYSEATNCILTRAESGRTGYVCVANVHMVMEAYKSPIFSEIINNADLVVADGMPLVWGLRIQGIRSANRVYGPELTPYVLTEAEKNGVSVGFYGGSEETLQQLIEAVNMRFPRLKIAYTFSPPFRTLLKDERVQIVRDINSSGAKILFVGLGCPKQEYWMAENKNSVSPIMIGVGAAFDILAGTKPQAPPWMRKAGLEWLFRLFCEPGRLWRRYLIYNPWFIMRFSLQLIKSRFSGA